MYDDFYETARSAKIAQDRTAVIVNDDTLKHSVDKQQIPLRAQDADCENSSSSWKPFSYKRCFLSLHALSSSALLNTTV